MFHCLNSFIRLAFKLDEIVSSLKKITDKNIGMNELLVLRLKFEHKTIDGESEYFNGWNCVRNNSDSNYFALMGMLTNIKCILTQYKSIFIF